MITMTTISTIILYIHGMTTAELEEKGNFEGERVIICWMGKIIWTSYKRNQCQSATGIKMI